MVIYAGTDKVQRCEVCFAGSFLSTTTPRASLRRPQIFAHQTFQHSRLKLTNLAEPSFAPLSPFPLLQFASGHSMRGSPFLASVSSWRKPSAATLTINLERLGTNCQKCGFPGFWWLHRCGRATDLVARNNSLRNISPDFSASLWPV